MDSQIQLLPLNVIIKNKTVLSTTNQRANALEIIEAGINAVSVESLLKSVSFNQNTKEFQIQNDVYNLSNGRLFIVGGGKAALSMVQVLEAIISPENIIDGIVSCTNTGSTKKIKVLQASHPYPDEGGVAAVKQMLALKEKYKINQNDTILCLISGGGSALMPQPPEEITLPELQNVTKLLVSSGASIHEINTIRKHLSLVNGGRLGAHFSPARVISLIISDVLGNDPNDIASGPTAPDKTTFKDAWTILEKYNLLQQIPPSVYKYLEMGQQNKIEDSPKKLENCHNYVICDNQISLVGMKKKAEDLGYKVCMYPKPLIGDTGKVAKEISTDIKKGTYDPYDLIIMGGETTPKLPKNHGQGGRNEQFVAVVMNEMKEVPINWLLASVGTDGSDYTQDVAGAIADNESLETIKDQNINIEKYIVNFDTYNLFKQINGQVITGATGTNVGDIVLFMRKNN